MAIPDIAEREATVHAMFKMMDDEMNGELSASQVQAAHEMIRMGGISMPQVKASMVYVCVDHCVCEEWELIDLLKEMDRRYYLIQDFRWEFSMLDSEGGDTITEDQARWFMQSVHGQHFSRKRWDKFIKSRPAPGSKVSFAEIEVELCNVPCYMDVMEEEEEERRRKEEEARKKQLEQEERKRMKEKSEEDRKRLIEDQKRQQEEKEKEKAARKLAEEMHNELANKLTQATVVLCDPAPHSTDIISSSTNADIEKEKKKAEDEMRAKEIEAERLRQEEEDKKRREEERARRKKEKEDEDQRRAEEEARLERLRQEAEEKRKRDEEEAKNIESTAQNAADEEAAAAKAAADAREQLKRVQDAKSKKELEELEAAAKQRENEMKEKRIRANLKVAIKTRKRPMLRKGVDDFKKAKLKDHDSDLPKAEHLLKLGDAKERLKNAMAKRQLKDLEDAMNHVRKNNFEEDLQPEMIEANNLLLRLRRLERIRAEILELKQSTVAEIRSYSSPPVIVHSVMIGTFLILGHQEKETKEWKKVQALVGKTGKDGLKRRCLEYDPENLAKKMEIAIKAKDKMAAFELDDVRDVSAGAATFYLWASNMIEEAEMIEAQKKRDALEKDNDD